MDTLFFTFSILICPKLLTLFFSILSSFLSFLFFPFLLSFFFSLTSKRSNKKKKTFDMQVSLSWVSIVQSSAIIGTDLGMVIEQLSFKSV